ncbi:very short patch repair endonuclease [Microbacterium sp.]|uniref:very short patch repair endonuclease n=1 Tax=Microbacterium sp. TaxID=51671 RepID=UPI003F994B13
MSASWATNATTRKVMQGNRGRDTKPELAVRRLVHGRGLRYRVNARVEPDLRRTADLLFTRARVAVFIDGCYWHGCPDHCTMPKVNVAYWNTKIAGNRRRDIETTSRLTDRGWTVLRFWSHEVPGSVVSRIEEVVRDAWLTGSMVS